MVDAIITKPTSNSQPSGLLFLTKTTGFGGAMTTGPVQVVGEVLTVKRAGAYQHLTLVAPRVPERFRPGQFMGLDEEEPEKEASSEAWTRWLPLRGVNLCIDEASNLRLRVFPAAWPEPLGGFMTGPVIAIDNQALPTEASVDLDPPDEF